MGLRCLRFCRRLDRAGDRAPPSFVPSSTPSFNMRHHNFVTNTQSQSGTTDVRRAAGVSPIKSFEDAVFMLFRDSRPAVGNPKHRECTGFRERIERDPSSTLYLMALSSKFSSIRQRKDSSAKTLTSGEISNSMVTRFGRKDLRVFHQLVTDRAKVEHFLVQR